MGRLETGLALCVALEIDLTYLASPYSPADSGAQIIFGGAGG